MGFAEARARGRENAYFRCRFGPALIVNGTLRLPPTQMGKLGEKLPIGGVSVLVTFVQTPDSSRSPGLVFVLPGGRRQGMSFGERERVRAERFAAAVNVAGAWYAAHRFGDGSFSAQRRKPAPTNP